MMVLSDFNYDTDYCYRWLTFLFSEEVKLRYREYKFTSNSKKQYTR